jgi:hypothetical protein
MMLGPSNILQKTILTGQVFCLHSSWIWLILSLGMLAHSVCPTLESSLPFAEDFSPTHGMTVLGDGGGVLCKGPAMDAIGGLKILPA